MEARKKSEAFYFEGDEARSLESLRDSLKVSPDSVKSPELGGRILETGVKSIDEALNGGFPSGSLIELVGRKSSGVTSLAASLAASVSNAGGEVAWIDPQNTLDPQSLLEVGVDTHRFLWIRPHGHRLKHSMRATETVLDGGGFELVVVDLLERKKTQKNLPMSVWVRLAKRLEHRNTTCVILRHYPGVSSAQYRLRFLGEGLGQVSVELLKAHKRAVYSQPVVMPFAPPFD